MQNNKQASANTETLSPLTITPVGWVESPLTAPSLKGSKDGIAHRDGKMPEITEAEVESRIVLDPAYTGLIEGIEEFSHALVIYWPHLLPAEGRRAVKVHPAGFKDLPLVGVFATCSPARPNPLLVTVVKVLSREDNVLNVFGLEAVDKSPILDIKPYSKYYLSREDVTIAPWMKALEDKFRD